MGDVFREDGSVREVISVHAAYRHDKVCLKITSPKLRRCLADYCEKQQTPARRENRYPLFRSQRGDGMTASSVARYLTALYRKAGIRDGSSRSGRRTVERRLRAAPFE
jgi:hypothetical protein